MVKSKEGDLKDNEIANEEVADGDIDIITTYDPADGRTIDNFHSYAEIKKVIAGDRTLLESSNNDKDEYSFLKELDEFIQRSKKEEKAKDPDMFETEVLPELLNLINDGETLKALQKYCFFTDSFVELDEYPSYVDVLQKNPIFKDLITLKKIHDVIYGSDHQWSEKDFQQLIDDCEKGIPEITKTTSKQTSLVFSDES
jgi:hypothetical protein